MASILALLILDDVNSQMKLEAFLIQIGLALFFYCMLIEVQD